MIDELIFCDISPTVSRHWQRLTGELVGPRARNRADDMS